MIAADPSTPKLNEKYLYLEISGDAASSKIVAQKLKITLLGYPTAFVVNPETGVQSKMVYPGPFRTVDEFMASLSVTAQN